MAKLTTAARNNMPARGFALPHERKFPVPDAAHAAVAKGRAKQQFNLGKLSHAQLEEVDRKADAKLGEKDDMANGGKVAKKAPGYADGGVVQPEGSYADGGTVKLADMAPMFPVRKREKGPISQD
jgi:hypothetical protein